MYDFHPYTTPTAHIHKKKNENSKLKGEFHRGAIQEASCTIKSAKSLISGYRVSNCFITYTVNHHGIIWCDNVKSN